MREVENLNCEICGDEKARRFELYSFGKIGEPVDPLKFWLCLKCARTRRREIKNEQLKSFSPAESRTALIAEMDRFWDESGAGEICRDCHEQGTGCCPPMCRYLSQSGCQKKNVFCTGFVCSALLNAIAECDAEQARVLKWVKTNPGAAEFRFYEIVTRVPSIDREQVQPLALPPKYPGPLNLDGTRIQEKLLRLKAEILTVRRIWKSEDDREFLLNREDC